jgi:hypothetical protein
LLVRQANSSVGRAFDATGPTTWKPRVR